MAYASVNYEWVTAQVVFDIPFKYLKHEHLYARYDPDGSGEFFPLVQGTGLAEHYTITGDGTTITLNEWVNETFTNEITIVNVYRVTPLSDADRIVDFQAGSVLTEADLDNSTLQVFYAAQETADRTVEVMDLDPDGVSWDAENKKILNVLDPTADQHATTKGYVDTNKIDKDGTVAMDASLNMDTQKIINVVDPAAAQDAATKNYVDTSPLNRTTPGGTDEWDAETEKIINVVDPVASTDAATKGYVDTEDAKALNRTDPNDPATHWDATEEKITRVAEPIASTDAATKNYVDTVPMNIDGGAWDAESKKIKLVTDPAAAQDAATKNYVDTEDAKPLHRTDPDNTATHWDATGEKITNVAEPIAITDAATKNYVDDTTIQKDSGEWDAETTKIKNVVYPVSNTDAATKLYVDDAATGAGNLPTVSVADNDSGIFVNTGTWQTRTPTESRVHLDVQTEAEADARYALEANNLSDLANVVTARTNIGLGTQEPCILKTAALVDTGTGATNVALNSSLTAGDVVLGIPVAEWTWLSGALTESTSVTISTTHRRDVMTLSNYNGMASYITMGVAGIYGGYVGVDVQPGIYRLQAAMVFKETEGNDASLTVRLASSSGLSGVVNIYGSSDFWSYSHYEGNLTVVIDEIVDVTVASSFALYCWNTHATGDGTLTVDGFSGAIKATCTRISDT